MGFFLPYELLNPMAVKHHRSIRLTRRYISHTVFLCVFVIFALSRLAGWLPLSACKPLPCSPEKSGSSSYSTPWPLSRSLIEPNLGVRGAHQPIR